MTEEANLSASLIERLRSTAQLPVCPFDRRSPDYYTAGENNAPCTVCGGTEEVDKCRGADTRIMEEAAARIETLEAAIESNTKALGFAQNGRCAAEVQVEALRKVLGPFAAFAQNLRFGEGDLMVLCAEPGDIAHFHAEEFKRAAEALAALSVPAEESDPPMAWVIRAPNGNVRWWGRDQATAIKNAEQWGAVAVWEELGPRSRGAPAEERKPECCGAPASRVDGYCLYQQRTCTKAEESSAQASDLRSRQWLFEYEHNGATWGFTVPAGTAEDAIARVRAIAGATLAGEVGEKIPVPTPWTPQVVAP